MDYEYNQTNNMTVVYHPQHGHIHTENWIEASLRKRPDDPADPNYNQPLNWDIIGNTQKISFCLVNSATCVCSDPWACTDISPTDILTEIDNYTGSASNLWSDPLLGLWGNANFLKNKLAQFPNYLLGKRYQCNENQHQGIAPGLLDIYGANTPGNAILLPCDLPTGQYYIVAQVDPTNTYEEENNENNLTVVPVSITMPTEPPIHSNQVIIPSGIYGEPANNVTWSLDNRINGVVKIPAGKTLTIEHCTIEFMTPQSGIIVEKGGALHLHNATLRGNECLGNVWKGIVVDGDANHSIWSGANYNLTDHGIAHVENAIIQDALIGVQVGSFVPTMGGGILKVADSRFINNSVAIYYMPHFIQEVTNIEEVHVEINAPFKAEHRFPDLGYTGILLINRSMVMYNCHFSNTNYTIPREERGTGIITYRSEIAVGGTSPCTFNNLYKGIDAYAAGSLYSGHYIYNNTFTSVAKGITLNGNAMSEIRGNTFEYLLSDDYAVFAMHTPGVDIGHNTLLVSSMPNPGSNKPYGITLRNSGKVGSIIHNNTFKAIVNDACLTPPSCLYRFRTAIQTEGGNNPNVLIDCNQFQAISDYDIRVFDSYDFKDQGGCNDVDPIINPTANNWHNPAIISGTYHIYYHNNTETFNVTYEPGYQPSLVSYNITTDECTDESTDCTAYRFEGSEIGERIAYLQNGMSQSATWQEYERFYAELMRTYLQNHLYAQAKTETEARNDAEGNKILIATYADERNLALADSLLQTLPLQNQDDADFYSFFSAYLAQLQTNPYLLPFDGKAPTAAALQIQNMAAPATPPNSAALFAQSVQATQQNIAYTRMPADEVIAQIAYVHKPAVLRLMPNPAQNETYIWIETPTTMQLATRLNVYDYTGRLLLTQPLPAQNTYQPIQLNTQTLPNGLYICELLTKDGSIVTGKLIISR